MRLTRLYRFASSHRLHSPALSEPENRELYGKCNNPFGHGHNYVLRVRVSGGVDPLTGRVINPEALDRYVAERVISGFDHRDLNHDVSAFSTLIPTSENIVAVIARRLQEDWESHFPGVKLDCLRLEETRNNFIEWTVQ